MADAPQDMIVLSGLTKRYGPIRAVSDLSLTVRRGDVLCFLGPNGAGKTTTMRMITGYVLPTAGRAEVCGHDVVADPLAARRRIGYVPEGAPLYGDDSPAAFLNFVAGARGLTGAERRRRIEYAVEALAIGNVLYRPIDTLSKGYKRRTALAQAIVHDPEVLILDEPTDGLDPNQKHHVRSLIRGMSKDKAIVISTHLLEEVDAVCNRAAVIARGRLIFDGTPEGLRRRSRGHNAVVVEVPAAAGADARRTIEGLSGVAAVEQQERNGAAVLRAYATEGRPIAQAVAEALRVRNLPVGALSVQQGQLDEVFRSMTAEA